MKRSEINRAIRWAENLLTEHGFRLPEAAYWDMDTWKSRRGDLDTVRRVMLGWDITDFGSGKFEEVGAVLYTIRNGEMNHPEIGVPYCEKVILMKDGQRLPKHYHVFKSEDIINRGGGVLEVRLWNADEDGKQLDTPVRIYQDGFAHVYQPGEPIFIRHGCSISLTPYVAHVFGPVPGSGDLVVGEVSRVNDDNTDNYFMEPTSRFADVDEDEPILHPLCNEYDKLTM